MGQVRPADRLSFLIGWGETRVRRNVFKFLAGNKAAHTARQESSSLFDVVVTEISARVEFTAMQSLEEVGY